MRCVTVFIWKSCLGGKAAAKTRWRSLWHEQLLTGVCHWSRFLAKWGNVFMFITSQSWGCWTDSIPLPHQNVRILQLTQFYHWASEDWGPRKKTWSLPSKHLSLMEHFKLTATAVTEVWKVNVPYSLLFPKALLLSKGFCIFFVTLFPPLSAWVTWSPPLGLCSNIFFNKTLSGHLV